MAGPVALPLMSTAVFDSGLPRLPESFTMTFLSIPIGPHDVPFAAPLMAAALLGFTIGFTILKLMDRVIVPVPGPTGDGEKTRQ